MSNNILSSIQNAIEKACPFIYISTPDQISFLKSLKGFSYVNEGEEKPYNIWRWDKADGLHTPFPPSLPSLLKLAVKYLSTRKKSIEEQLEEEQQQSQQGENYAPFFRDTRDIHTTLSLFLDNINLLSHTLVVFLNIHYILNSEKSEKKEEENVSHLLLKLRDKLASSPSSLIFLAPSFDNIPQELRGDGVYLDDPYPSDEEIEKVVELNYTNLSKVYNYPPLSPRSRSNYVSALRGTTKFGAEQVFALSSTEKGIDENVLWEQKKELINKTRGLELKFPRFEFKDVGGNKGVKEMLRNTLTGKLNISILCWIDEIGDAFAGTEGDSTGIKQDLHSQFLQQMEFNGALGGILVGAPGSSKSYIVEAAAGEFHIPLLALDLGALGQKYVGESESNVREMWKIINGMCGVNGVVLFLGTTNKTNTISPQLGRRFNFLGTIFHDVLLDKEEQEPVWEIQKKAWKIKEPHAFEAGLTGAEIRDICKKSYGFGVSLNQARKQIVPYYLSQKGRRDLDALRNEANGSYISAATGEVYCIPPPKMEEENSNRRYR